MKLKIGTRIILKPLANFSPFAFNKSLFVFGNKNSAGTCQTIIFPLSNISSINGDIAAVTVFVC